MKKEKFIERYGEAAYGKVLRENRDWYARHRREVSTQKRKWRKANPGKAKARDQEASRKGGRWYEGRLKYARSGLRAERKSIRAKHQYKYHPFKQIIAPGSQIHHEWIPGTAKYTGVALVESNPHRHGIIDVIKILEGEITLFRER